jgi:hypothetical protein
LNAPLPLILIAGLTLLLPGRAQAQSTASAKGSLVITDRSGDTLEDSNGTPLNAPRGDIVSAALDYTADQIRLALQVSQPTDPATDPKWASDATFLWWPLDTTGDGKVDYVAQFSLDTRGLTGIVTRPDAPDGAPHVCEAQASYSASSGYVLGLQPSCVGSPSAISYRAIMYYDTDPGNDKAPVSIDTAPDKSLAGPVAVASTPSPASAAAPTTASTVSRPQTSGGPTAASVPAATTHPPSPAERAAQAPPSAAAPATSPSALGQPIPQASAPRRPSPFDTRASVATGPPVASTGQSPGSPPASLPSLSSKHTAASPGPLSPIEPIEEWKGTVALVAILAVLLAWAAQVMVLAQRRRLRTATL